MNDPIAASDRAISRAAARYYEPFDEVPPKFCDLCGAHESHCRCIKCAECSETEEYCFCDESLGHGAACPFPNEACRCAANRRESAAKAEAKIIDQHLEDRREARG